MYGQRYLIFSLQYSLKEKISIYVYELSVNFPSFKTLRVAIPLANLHLSKSLKTMSFLLIFQMFIPIIN